MDSENDDNCLHGLIIGESSLELKPVFYHPLFITNF
jgi:hypothetical protein